MLSMCSIDRSKVVEDDDIVTSDKATDDPNANWDEHGLQLMWTWGCHQIHQTVILWAVLGCPKLFFLRPETDSLGHPY